MSAQTPDEQSPWSPFAAYVYVNISVGTSEIISNTSHSLRVSKGMTVSPSLLKAFKDIIADASLDWYNGVHMGRSALQLAVLVYSVPAPGIRSLRKSNHIMRLLTTNNNVYRHHTGQKTRPLLEFLELCETHSREKERNIILHHSPCADWVSMLVQSQDATGICDGGTV